MKYSDRGLADDRFWFNGGLRLFKILFWLANIFFILTNLGLNSSHYLYFQQNVMQKAYRSEFFPFKIIYTEFRARVCSQMIGNTISQEIFDRARYNNFWPKSIIVLFVLLTTFGIYWKKKRILCQIPKYQWNVLTLKQTVTLIILIYLNSVPGDYLVGAFPPSESLFIYEELRVILTENLITRFLLPILLILNTQRTLPALWAEKPWKRRDFFMTKLNFPETTISVEQEVSVDVEVSVEEEISVVQEGRRHRALGKHKDRTTTTTLANTATGSSLPEVPD